MNEELTSILGRLLDDSPGADAYHLRLVDDFAERDVSPQETDELFSSFLADFENAVDSVKREWGDPTYRGAVDRDDFPAWSEALMLAYWRRSESLAFISLRHDDDHQPMFLEVGALTDDEVSTLTYTKS